MVFRPKKLSPLPFLSFTRFLASGRHGYRRNLSSIVGIPQIYPKSGFRCIMGEDWNVNFHSTAIACRDNVYNCSNDRDQYVTYDRLSITNGDRYLYSKCG